MQQHRTSVCAAAAKKVAQHEAVPELLREKCDAELTHLADATADGDLARGKIARQ